MMIAGAVILSLALAAILAGLAVRWYYLIPLRKLLHEIRQLRYGQLEDISTLSSPLIVQELSHEYRRLFEAYQLHQKNTNSQNIKIEREVACRTERFKKALRRIEKSSRTDSLTGLANRNHFEKWFTMLFNAARHQNTKLACLVLDIDQFKSINDSWGHCAADRVLKFTGQLIQGVIRQDDFAARIGGDEFMILLNGCDELQAWQIAERIRSLFEHEARQFSPQPSRPLVENNHIPTLTPKLSIGLATTGNHPRDALHLLHLADQALYEAKRTGRNCVVAFRTKTQNPAEK